MDMPRRLGAEFFGTFWLTFAAAIAGVVSRWQHDLPDAK